MFEKDDSHNVFQPDIFVVCDPKKIFEERIYGTPDFIIEVISPSNSERDYGHKLNVYMKCGVREYWIITPETDSVLVYTKEKDTVRLDMYTFEDKIKTSIFEDFEIDFKTLQI